ncbi:MAG: helix-turn-helix transcriptional regulator [Anaerolineaceae bacterium]
MSLLDEETASLAIGVTLRSARIQRGLSVEQVAQDTRISARFIEALEDEMFDELPAPVYVRGFLRSYANYLKVDANALLEELNGGGRPIAGPESFLGGPAGPQARPQRESSNPFQRTPLPPSVPLVLAAAGEGSFDGAHEKMDASGDSDDWDPAEQEFLAEEPRRPVTGFYYENEPTVEALPGAEEEFRPRRTPGVLVASENAADGGGGTTRLVALGGALVIVGLGVLAAAVLLTGGGSNDTNQAAATATATPTTGTGTVIAVASVTASATASASASPAASPSPGGTPGTTTPVPSGTPAAATTTPLPDTPAPTATATAATEPPTATPVPPTPRPTPTVFVLTPGNFSECSRSPSGQIDCGSPPYLVVCSPNGWFIDLPPSFARPEAWRTAQASTIGEAIRKGDAGCQ